MDLAGGTGSLLRRWWHWLLLLAGVATLQWLFRTVDSFPAGLDTFFSDPIDRFARWSQANRRTHWLFTTIFNPFSDAVRVGLNSVESALLWVPWFVLPIAVFLLVARSRNRLQAVVASLAMAYPGVVGLWEVTVETLALMTIAVLFSVLLGVPLGVACALHQRVNQAMRPVLDAMQTVPAPVYFVPMALFFGIGAVPATMATVIYALPPVVRLTTLGIMEVPSQAVEASTVFGASRRQTLRKVQLPMAMPTIMAGVTQTIMMALGIVVLATLLGAGGLGQEVMATLTQRRTGRGIATGLTVVAIAVVLDRVGRAIAGMDRSTAPGRMVTGMAIGGVLSLVLVGRVVGWIDFPEMWDVKAFDPIDDLMDWIRDNLRWFTRGMNDAVIIWFYLPVRDFLTETLAWPVLVFGTAWTGWRVRNWHLAVFIAGALTFIGLIGMWDLSIDTLTQVVAAVILSVVIAIPVGIWAGQSRRVEAALGPLLDAFQTIPSLVYIIPAVTLFTVGVVPGIIASVIYALPPGVRITALGISQVPEESLEASEMFGASPRQTLIRVRLPLAAATIMVGINQVIMMVLAMVIISGLVGGGGLGFETVSAVKNSDVGIGFEVGAAIVAMAMVLDRLTQAGADRFRPPAAT
ncbi:MAG: ABC transporter permease subunit [Acidimicrobiia bacterium]|nr:ABC transporter permease subunit [Actinomycetota bacterium]MBL6925384.1 ABC transporter permease subunit [Acidimicrobiia bacterium]MBL6926806.1 ABC transporter permease subunit [Acidimicrobiia bacterium]